LPCRQSVKKRYYIPQGAGVHDDAAIDRIDAVESQSTASEQREMKHPSFLNWFLLVLSVVISAITILAVIPPLLSARLAEFWPVPKPQLALLVVLTLTLVALVGLVHQRRYLSWLRREFDASKRDAEERARRHAARVYALLNVSRMLGSWSDINKVFDSVTDMCVEIFHSDSASLMLVDNDTGELVVTAASGCNVDPKILGARQRVGEGVAGYAAERCEAMLLRGSDTSDKYPGLTLKTPSITASMVVPIMVRDELVGVINATSRASEAEYDKDDLRALQVFAENVGTCIRHTEHMDWMRATIQNLQDTIKRPSSGSPV